MADDAPSTTRELIEAYLSPQRQGDLDPFIVMTFMPIEPYDHVADIGCGPGYFSVPLAKYLVYGKLYALDIQDEMLEALRQQVLAANLGNVEILECSPTEFPVATGSLDGVFMAFVVHENEDRIALFKATRELLKERGWCVVLEWHQRETDDGPPLERRVNPEELEVLARDSGFQFRWCREINGRQYMAMLRK